MSISNLYEEGKVCLSILGTWSGDKDEVWSAARSSLLQAFVSIQGLVLVKEPYACIFFLTLPSAHLLVHRWFCEPAFDKLRGTEEGTVNRSAHFHYKIDNFSDFFSTADFTAKKRTSCRVDSFAVHWNCRLEVWSQKYGVYISRRNV